MNIKIVLAIATAFFFGLFVGWLVTSWSTTDMVPESESVANSWSAHIIALTDSSNELRERDSVVTSNIQSFLGLTTALGLHYDSIRDSRVRARVLSQMDRATVVLDAIHENEENTTGLNFAKRSVDCIIRAGSDSSSTVESCISEELGKNRM